MNWEEIEKKYPKAHGLFDDWYVGNIKISWKNFLLAPPRRLYDFFDENNLFIEVHVYNESISGKLHFTAQIWEDAYSSALFETKDHPTRPEAETEAFNKAFEILEKQLRKG